MTGPMMAREDNVHNPCRLRLPSLHIQVSATGGVGNTGVLKPEERNRRSWEDAELAAHWTRSIPGVRKEVGVGTP